MDDNVAVVAPTRRNSIIWQYFEVNDEDNKTAICKKCFNQLSYKTTVTNLRSHYKKKHGILLYGKESDEDNKMEGKILDDGDTSRPKRRTSVMWKFFTKLEHSNDKARCKFCQNDFAFGSSTNNLKSHLRAKHKNIYDSLQNGKIVMPDDQEDMSEREEYIKSDGETTVQTKNEQRRKKSKAWKYFKKLDHGNCLAKCNLCANELSYYSSVTNLVRHVQRQHGLCRSDDSSSDDDDLQGVESDEDNQQDNSRHMAWLYFKCKDPVLKISVCLICKKRVSSMSVSNLKKHLTNKHPQLKLPEEHEGLEKQVIISEDGQLYEIETLDDKDDEDKQNETEAIDTVYLDDYIDEPQVTKNKSRLKRKRNNRVRSNKVLHKFPSSDEEVTRNREEDSIDHFAKYATSLLRQLPKNISDQLQMEFIKEILNAKINLSQTVTVVPSNSYSITITNQEASEKNGVSNTVDELNK